MRCWNTYFLPENMYLSSETAEIHIFCLRICICLPKQLKYIFIARKYVFGARYNKASPQTNSGNSRVEEKVQDKRSETVHLKKGDVVPVRVASLAAGGEGVSRQYGVPVFVSRVAPGDLVEVRLFDVRKDFARGEVIKLLEPSAVRVEAPCKLFKVCGGCQWQHISYSGQLDAKADIVRQALKHIGKLPPDLVQPALGAVEPLFYRNKVQFPVDSVKGSGRVLAGYYKENSHELVNIKHCPVQPEPLDRVLEACKQAVQSRGLSTYDETTGRGLLRHIALRYSFARNRVLATLIINAEPPAGQGLGEGLEERLSDIAQDVMNVVPELVGVCANFNPRAGNRIMGDTTICLHGEEHIVEVLRSNLPAAPEALRNGIQYSLSSTSFFQVNSWQASVLLDQILLAVSPDLGQDAATTVFSKKIPLLLDAYAGVGTMALWLAPLCDRVLAIEEWQGAVDDGLKNRELNGIANVEFISARVEDEVPRLLEQGVKPDVIVVDPPRKGLHPRALESLISLQAAKIVYVSCNPATLARDLRILEDNGYKTKRIQPVDLFPQTHHVESVTILERQGSQS
jgi:23S rRNA (uracil1939-C5)-methyltransferase